MQAVECSPAVSAPKVDFATDLFNMLSMDGPSINTLEAASTDDNAWAGFQSAAEASVADKTGSTEPDAKKTNSSSGIEDLFQDSPSLVSAVSEKPQKDAKTDIMSLLDKVQVGGKTFFGPYVVGELGICDTITTTTCSFDLHRSDKESPKMAIREMMKRDVS